MVAEILEGGARARREGVEPHRQHTHGFHALELLAQGCHPPPPLGDQLLGAGRPPQGFPNAACVRIEILQRLELLDEQNVHLGAPEQVQDLRLRVGGSQHQIRLVAQDVFRLAVGEAKDLPGLLKGRAVALVPGQVAQGRDLPRRRQGQEQIVGAHRLRDHALRRPRPEKGGE